MKKMKVTIVVGTRPEIIRLACVIQAVDRHFDLTLVHTGQNYDYELNEIFFDDLQIRKPDHFLEAAGKNAAETIGNTISRVDSLLAEHPTEALLVLGQRVPEEINRKIVDHISDINMTYSDIAREYLLREGLPPDRIIKTGSPMFEVLNHYADKIEQSDVLKRLDLTANNYFVVSAHREENVDSEQNFSNLAQSLNQIAEVYSLPIIFSAHPRTRNRIESAGIKFNELIRLMKPLAFTEFVHLQKNARATLSDSGTITEESSILNFPALNIREAHERPEGMEEASVMMTGLAPNRIMQGLEILQSQPRGTERLLRPVADYSMPNVSEKVCRIILGYTDYVNRVVWRR